MSERPALGSWEWIEANPERLAILNTNYDSGREKNPPSFLLPEPWRVIRGHRCLHAAETYEQAAEFLRGKLVEVP